MTIRVKGYNVDQIGDEVIVHRDSHERILTLRTEKTLSAEERKKLVEIAMEMRDEM